MTEYNAILEKSRRFAVRIVKLYQYLDKTKVPRALSDQILRSGTSIGANAAEAHLAPSSTDFYCKLGISLKEAKETEYYLYTIHYTLYIVLYTLFIIHYTLYINNYRLWQNQ